MNTPQTIIDANIIGYINRSPEFPTPLITVIESTQQRFYGIYPA